MRLKDARVLGWLYMMRVFTKMERMGDENIQGLGLTGAQFDVIAQLSQNEGISQQGLSEKLFVTKGNVCGLLGRMEEKGWVKREDDPTDRRAHRLYLTEAGRQLAERVMPVQEQFIVEQMSVLTDEEQTTFRSLLRQLDKSLAPR
ncbi:MAG: MarR family transcriptional regulator [Chloroflexia bacterium]